MDRRIRTISISDSLIFLEGIKKIIVEKLGISLIGEYRLSKDLFEDLGVIKPDIALMELRPDKKGCFDLIKSIRQEFPDLKIVVISNSKSDQTVVEAFQAGVCGYIHLNSGIETFKNCFKVILKGEFFIDEKLSVKLARRFLDSIVSIRSIENEPYSILSKREIEVMKLFLNGKNSKEIAELLFISPKTVENHKYNIMKKLGLKNEIEFVKYAIKKGMINLND
ncbi:MAG: LuxR C-terminal-related transcriptional regulator [Promethearchaeota archaeon]